MREKYTLSKQNFYVLEINGFLSLMLKEGGNRTKLINIDYLETV